jgi:hypothetical protein
VISILQKRDILSIILIILICIGVRISVFPADHALDLSDSTPFFSFLNGLLPASPLVRYFTANALIALQAFWLNRLCEKHSVMQSKTWLPGIIYFMLAGIYPWQNIIQPHILTNFALLLLIDKIASFYEAEHRVESKLMDIGLILTLFVVSSVEGWYFILFAIVSISLFIFYDINRIFLLVMSIAVPLIMIIATYYFFGQLTMLKAFIVPVQNFGIDHIADKKLILGPLSYPAILGAMGMALMQIKMSGNPSKVRKIHMSFYTLIAIEVFILILSKHHFEINSTLFPLPLSVFISYFFVHSRYALLKDALFMALIVIIIFAQLFITK